MKKLVVTGSVALALVLAYGCSGGSTTIDPGAAADSGKDTSTTATDSGPTSTADTGTTADSGKDTGSTADSGSVLTGAPLKFHGCPTFTACGGAVPGSWDFTGGCIEDPLAAFKSRCAGLVEKKVQGTIQGNVMFTGTAVAGTATRSATVGFVTDVEFPGSGAGDCTGGFGCAGVSLGIGTILPGASATCTGTATCACTITVSNTDSLSNTYTVVGNSINIANGEKYDFCITGTKLQYKQTAAAPGKQINDGTFDLVKK